MKLSALALVLSLAGFSLAAGGSHAAPDRFDCNEIRGTEYESDSERAWFLANCTTPATADATVEQECWAIAQTDEARPRGLSGLTVSGRVWCYDSSTLWWNPDGLLAQPLASMSATAYHRTLTSACTAQPDERGNGIEALELACALTLAAALPGSIAEIEVCLRTVAGKDYCSWTTYSARG
jgi:hypothetical protein